MSFQHEKATVFIEYLIKHKLAFFTTMMFALEPIEVHRLYLYQQLEEHVLPYEMHI